MYMEFLYMSAARVTFSDDNLDFIRILCATRINLNIQYQFGYTLFHLAVNIPEDNIRVVQELIRAGADVNMGNHLDFTPLHFATIHRKTRVFSALIQGGAFVNAQAFLGATALHMAVIDSRTFDIPFQIMGLPNAWIIDELMQQEDIDCNLLDSKGDSPLMVAVKDQQAEATFKLLDKNLDPNIANKEFKTPLHVAFSQPENAIEMKLLLSGANIYTKDKMGRTPMDILIQNGLDQRYYEWVILIMKVIAFKYCITNVLKRKLKCKPGLYQFFNNCCQEVDKMRIDIISGKLTIHDFVMNCFNENQFESVLLQIHKPVVDRLTRDVYPEYFIVILDVIPESSLIAILEITVLSKNYTKIRKMDDLAGLFSITDIIHLISKYLSKVDLFCLIVAFSDVKISDSMQNMHERELFFCFVMNSEYTL